MESHQIAKEFNVTVNEFGQYSKASGPIYSHWSTNSHFIMVFMGFKKFGCLFKRCLGCTVYILDSLVLKQFLIIIIEYIITQYINIYFKLTFPVGIGTLYSNIYSLHKF